MNNQKFKPYYNIPGVDYFEIRDTNQTEFYNGKPIFKSKIIWTQCNEYFLVIKETQESGPLKSRDTLFVTILYRNQDTLTYLASAYGKTFKLKAIKIKSY
jgi:hypothetical protein